MELILHRFSMELKHTFTIAHDSRSTQNTLIVELKDGNLSGYGEATENPYYGVTFENMEASLASIKSFLKNYELTDPFAFWEIAQKQVHLPFALCALDMAAHDLFGKKQGKHLYEIWNLDKKNIPLTNYTIGIDTIEKMIFKLKEFPWALYKIKLGTPNDIEIIKALRQHTDARFRVDANCAWTAEQTVSNSHELKALGVEFIEQPLKAADWEGMKIVLAESALPIIADESCIVEQDVLRCAGFFHGINIKLTKCGGLTPAHRMIDLAKSLGMKVMMGCMTESLVGISAIANIAPKLDYVDMDGAMLLKTQIATGVEITPQEVIFPETKGTGAKLIG